VLSLLCPSRSALRACLPSSDSNIAYPYSLSSTSSDKLSVSIFPATHFFVPSRLDATLDVLYITAMSERKQINVRMDQETIDKIEWLRANTKPIPTASDAIRTAVNNEYERARKRIAAQSKG